MSYAQKIGIYQGDCKVLLGKYKNFSDYIKEFAKNQTGNGLDVGVGPNAVNGKFFNHCLRLDGCDVDVKVVESIPKEYYSKKFVLDLSKDIFPYSDNVLDFIVCSCVIQHLNSFNELREAFTEIFRILKYGGTFYCMFKIGTNDTNLTHFNSYYSEERTFRVFTPEDVITLCSKLNLLLLSSEILLDENFIPYCRCIFKKN